MSDWLLGTALGVLLGLYTWFVVGRIKKQLLLRSLTATAVALLCLDIWGVPAMLLAHLAVCVALFDCVFLLAKWLCPRWRQHISQIQKSHLLPIILFLLVIWYGGQNMAVVYRTDYTVTTEKSVREEGYRIAFLSDVHYGTVQNKSVLQENISRINAQQPDIVILGGDIVEEGTSLEEMQEVFYHLGCLDAPLGVYFVYGNHDRQADSKNRSYTDEELIAAIENNGITILEDETQLIGGELLLIGRADAAWDQQSTRKEIRELLLPEQEGLFLLTLDHQPLEAAENAAAVVDLMLSGHTHAGQIFPVGYLTEWNGGMNYGLYQTGKCQSIVSSGFAGWGYGIRTQGHCEYVIVDIVPSAG